MESIINLIIRIVRSFAFFMLCDSIINNQIHAFNATVILIIFYEKLDSIENKLK